VEANDQVLDEEMRCSQEQANELVRLLQHALDNRMNVVVHCTAGVCRSGAVAEVGVMMGFDDCERFRSPNLLVKHRMMKALGWTYDEQEPHTINGVAVPEEWTTTREKIATLAKARRSGDE
jgi:rhodanese-related sulfurtransferase